MKRVSFAMPFAVVVLVSACASTPKATPAELLLGPWSCVATRGDITTNADVTYLSGGTGTVKAKVSMLFSGQPVEITGAGSSAWSFLPDGRLEETLTALTVTSGQMGGNPVPTAMIQPLIEKQMVNQKTVSTADIAAKRMVLTGADSVTTTCTR